MKGNAQDNLHLVSLLKALSLNLNIQNIFMFSLTFHFSGVKNLSVNGIS